MKQLYSSAATSINSIKAPAIYGMKKAIAAMNGKNVLDVGGGKYDTGVNAAMAYGAKVVVYDPYNRSHEHNENALSRRYDVAILSNVLNVINSLEARADVLNLAANHAGKILVTVYEGNGSGAGCQTGADSWQENRKTADYIQEIAAVLHGWEVVRHGKLIEATKH